MGIIENKRDILCSGVLSTSKIDEVSSIVEETLSHFTQSSRETLRVRLTVETVMEIWAGELSETAEYRLLKSQRFGKNALILQVDGKSINPIEYKDNLLLSVSTNPNIVIALGLPVEYRYTGGKNELVIQLQKKKTSPMLQVVFAILAAFLIGVVSRWVIPDTAGQIAATLFVPLMNVITNALRLISGPLIFLSIISGFSGIGDTASLSKMGGTLLARFVIITFIIAALTWLSVCWMFPLALSVGVNGENAFLKIFEMILDVVPADIITPFQQGNALQIIFIAGCIGVATTLLGDAVSNFTKLVNQINSFVQLLMTGISKILPIYIFLSISNLIISSDISELSQILVPVLSLSAGCLLLTLVYGIYASVKTKFPLKKLFNSQLPSFLLALTTASSSAAFSANVECCEKKLNIDERIVKFGIPFGQVLFKPGGIVVFVFLCLYMAKEYAVPITPGWLIIMMFIASILVIAGPPVPGGTLSCIVVLFTQLGIPISCMANCAIILMFTDYMLTACDIACLQYELLINAKKWGLLRM